MADREVRERELRRPEGLVVSPAGHDSGTGTKDKIASKQRFFFFEVITQMVTGVPRRVNSAQRRPVSLNPSAVFNVG